MKLLVRMVSPNPDIADEELLSITLKNQQNKEIVVFGLRDYKTNRKDVTYFKCENEKDLLYDFLTSDRLISLTLLHLEYRIF